MLGFGVVLFVSWWWLGRRRSMLDDRQALSQQQQVSYRHTLLAQYQQADRAFSPAQSILCWKRWLFGGLLWLLRLGLLGLVLLVLAQPYRLLQPTIEQVEQGREVVLVVESSVTFLLKDYALEGQPVSRMTVVKKVLDQFLSELDRHNSIAMVLFADQAYRLLPMTDDLSVARLMLPKLQPYLAGRNDAAMGEALGLAMQPPYSAQPRLLILISDGASEVSRLPLAEVVAYAQANQFVIYALGMGAGQEYNDGVSGLLYQPLDETHLRYLAEQTGGQYYRVNSAQDLSEMLQRIQQAQAKQTKQVQQAVKKQFLWPQILPFILVGLALYVAYLLLLVRLGWGQK